MPNLIAGLFESIARRIFGGWLHFPRWAEHLFNIVGLGIILYFLFSIVWWKIIAILVIIQCFFWGKGHGAFYDLGHHGYPDAEMIKRYEQAWGYKIACKIFPESAWYGYWFDTFLMFIRYTLPALALIPFLDWVTGFAGMGVTLSYMLGWYLQDKGCKFFGDKFKGFCGSATNFGEIGAGFCLGVLL